MNGGGGDEEFTAKYVMVGDSGVGKTNILERYISNEFHSECATTIGVAFSSKTVLLKSGRRIRVQCWDTAGQERYRAMTSAYYRGALGIIVVFDLTQRESLDHIAHWVSEIRGQASPDVVVVLVGNKSDLSGARVVSSADAREIADEHGWSYLETSAKDNVNIRELFESLSESVVKNLAPGSTGTSPADVVPLAGNSRDAEPWEATRTRSSCC